MPYQQDLFGAKAARDEALTRVAGNAGPWLVRAVLVISRIERGWAGTGEDLRFIIEREIEKPHHHNVYGAVTRTAIRRRLIIPTGELRHMVGKKSHARRTMVYRRT